MKLKTYSLSVMLIAALIDGNNANAQNWLTTGNTGTSASTNFIGTIDNVAFKIRTKNVVRMTVTGSGNVGIGTGSPAAKLDVNGTGNFSGTLKVGAYTLPVVDGTSGQVLKTNGAGTLAWSNDNGTTYTAGTGISIAGSTINSVWTATGNNIYNNNSANVGIGTSTPNAALHFANVISNRRIVLFENNNNDNQFYGFGINNFALRYQTGTTQADHVFYASVDATTSNELMRVKGTGNVGIGTPTPDARLQIKYNSTGGSSAQLTLDESDSTDYARLNMKNASGSDYWSIGAKNAATLAPERFSIYNSKAGTDYLTITGFGGYVGIGTTTPTYKLDVNGDARFTGWTYFDSKARFNNVAYFPSNSFPTNAYMLQGIPNAGKLGILREITGGVDTVMMISGTNVGIGTTNPTAKLSFDNGTGNKISFYSNGANHYGIGLDANRLQFYTESASNNIAFGYGSSTAFTERMRIQGNGNVGIGTTSPSARLEIRHNSSGTSPHLTLDENDADYARINLKNNSGSSYWSIGALNNATQANERFSIYNSKAAADLMMITGTGNVGIGTTTPDYKLDVCGTIRASEVRVEIFGCDYVFDKDYKLRSIEELDEYINTNKHLPGVVSAAEVEKEGWKLGEMNKAMLEKIEELTLYMIQLSKENKELKKEIEIIKNK